MATNDTMEDEDEGSYGHIPISLRDCVTKFEAHTINVAEKLPTIFIGIYDDKCKGAHWADNVKRIKLLFQIEDATCIEVKVPSMRRDEHKVDYKRCGEETTKALDLINKGLFTPRTDGTTSTPSTKIRIVRMGVSNSDALTEAVETLIRGWCVPAQDKLVQLVSLGDTNDSKWMKFARSIALRQICKSVEYYNTMDYNIYGFVNQSREKNAEADLSAMLSKLMGDFSPKMLTDLMGKFEPQVAALMDKANAGKGDSAGSGSEVD